MTTKSPLRICLLATAPEFVKIRREVFMEARAKFTDVRCLDLIIHQH